MENDFNWKKLNEQSLQSRDKSVVFRFSYDVHLMVVIESWKYKESASEGPNVLKFGLQKW